MQLSIHSPKLLRGAILAAITLFLIHLKLSGEINDLVSPIVAAIIGIASIPLSVISLTTILSSLLKFKPLVSGHENGHSVHEHGEGDGHTHLDHKAFWYRLTIGLMVLFIVLAATWHPSALGTNMISGQTSSLTLNSSSPSQPASSGSEAINTVGKGPTQADLAFKYNENPKSFIGKSYTLMGFVYHPNDLPKNQFILTRFYIFCCIADAIPIGITVESPNANEFKSDSWVQLSGTLQTETLPALEQLEPTSWVPRDKGQPVLIAHSIKAIATPSKPYMVPGL